MTPTEKRAKVRELRLAGATYADIARIVGYADASGARLAYNASIAENPPDRSQVSALDTELARLDAMLTGLWTKARRGDYAAVDRVMAIDRRRAELLGQEGASTDDRPKEATSLSDFEKRLAERRQRATGPKDRSTSG